jgi:hypothetical protein
MRTSCGLLHAALCAGAALAAAGCGGRTGLVALPQVGQLSPTAVVGNDAGVRLMVRTDVWRGPPLGPIVPVEVTIDNGSTAPLRIGHSHFALISAGNRLAALIPSAILDPNHRLPTSAMAEAALQEQVLEAGSRVTGFVYFDGTSLNDDVDLVMRLIEAPTGTPFGAIEMAFRAG